MEVLVLACFVSGVSPFLGSVQSVAVTGKLNCNGKPAENVKVKLYEREVLLDTLLDKGFSNETGEFYLEGSKQELSVIDPKVNIYHRCNYDGVSFRSFQ
ncbi:Transthyretin-like family protein [Ancylostoma ceylanicum]|uniref:Transthyretin-like family protein n=1 Tax=Ancylostoma ceylanicum TaxID=53326 RepID=A0A0D6LW04_9BILA|nr:Transthyretin-like family protein [Ancylostoma ceylanicum]